MSVRPPLLSEIETAAATLAPYIRHTPLLSWVGGEKERLTEAQEVTLKLELFQLSGSFKLRGALLNVLALDEAARTRGVTAVSAGNHAIALSMAAKILNSHAKVVMPRSANPYRVETCRKLGAEVLLVNDVKEAFERVEQIRTEEGRSFVHPFEGETTALGTATVGYEFVKQSPDTEVFIIPIGGGGLAAGMAAAIRQLRPEARIFGVEPFGADSMWRSFQSGKPESIEKVQTIADSLGAPFAMPYSFGLCQMYLESVVRVEDEEIRRAMRLLFTEFKLAAEPACAASLAALLGPLRQELAGKKVGLIACGSNIDVETFSTFLL
ncbi:MAG: pyridoxal-phosphate dependent enzyme [Bacteroidetes bacterium]|nr:MAG: pyridoxal-phosphate dependent enzyme [Bacteroidota bacterium]